MKPLKRAGARRQASASTASSSSAAECSTLSSNQLGLSKFRSSPSSMLSSPSSSSVSGSGMASYSPRTSPFFEECDALEVIEHLKRSEGISDWQYLELVDRCGTCGENFLPKYIAAHECSGKDAS